MNIEKGYMTVAELQQATAAAEEKDKNAAIIRSLKKHGIMADDITVEVIKQLDQQNRKGKETYGHSLEDCPEDKYDWRDMINQELIDALQYYEKEVRRLNKIIKQRGGIKHERL